MDGRAVRGAHEGAFVHKLALVKTSNEKDVSMSNPSMQFEQMRQAYGPLHGEEIPGVPGGIALLPDSALEEFSGGLIAEIKKWLKDAFGGGGDINVNIGSPGARAGGTNSGPGSGDGKAPPGCTCAPPAPPPRPAPHPAPTPAPRPRPPRARDPKLW
jgi:hypothetical protein